MSVPSPPGWYQDPTGQGLARFWNGASWTQSVNVNGVTVNIPIDPVQAQVPPVAGTQVSLPPPPPVATGNDSVASGSSMGIFIGVAIAFLIGILIFAIVSNNSGDETPTPGSTPSAPATETPATPATEAPTEGG